MKRFALFAVATVALAGCASNTETQPLQAAAVDTTKMPQSGIFTVKDVVVTEQGADTLRLAAATTSKYTFADLSAVVWCRAREEATARKYDGWYQDGIQQVSNGEGQPRVAIATARYFKGKPPEGRKTLKHEKSPCNDVPAVAKVKV
ncbi:membrane lipoprotein lipid attachment site-containing protein [Rhodomicrobium vannielii ATCC 17100]|uniref:membrane lipoprotein lipid attachment site-containing protein n=1 Tax=Rhodomicrobium vannielii TaxID=1069 RepID=UPI00191A8663|nr:membrane lipoprotein lipid attachment site-containing protein [Rhodomicrobium vannielii]MBJ7535987.1 membrane lipoprotein lipid attachment site-containing protein [Rhodomicrobium vannielii ATCC 17100]